MITKDNILDFLINWFITLSVPAGFLGVLLELNPVHAVLGAVGQSLFLGINYMQSVTKGKRIKTYPSRFVFVSILVGGTLSLLGTPFLVYLTSGTYKSEIAIATIIGLMAQKAVDILSKFINKKIGTQDEEEYS